MLVAFVFGEVPLHVALVTARSVLWEEYCDLLSDPFARVSGDIQEAGRACPGPFLLLPLKHPGSDPSVHGAILPNGLAPLGALACKGSGVPSFQRRGCCS